MAQGAKVLLCKHEDPSVHPQHQVKARVAGRICSARAKEMSRDRPVPTVQWAAISAISKLWVRSVREPVSK